MWFKNWFARDLYVESNFTHGFYPSSLLERFACVKCDEHTVYGAEPAPFACKFSKVDGNLAAVSDETGGIFVLDTTKSGPRAVVQDWQSLDNAVMDLDWVPGEATRLITGAGDQKARLWDVTTKKCERTFSGHTGSIITVNCCPDKKTLFATGARDGHVKIWATDDTRTSATTDVSVRTIPNAHAPPKGSGTPRGKNKKLPGSVKETGDSVSAVVFVDENTLISAGTVDGLIKMWDLRNLHRPKHTLPYVGSSRKTPGFSCLTLDVSRKHLFASCTDSVIYQYNMASSSRQPVAKYRGHEQNSEGKYYVKTSLSPDDRYLVSGSTDSHAYIWQVDSPWVSPLKLTGHCDQVSAVAWCPVDVAKLVTLSDDGNVRVWRWINPEAPVTHGGPDSVTGRCKKTRQDQGVSARSPGSRSGPLSLRYGCNTGRVTAPPSSLEGSVEQRQQQLSEASSAMRDTLAAMEAGAMSPRKPAPPRALVSTAITKFFSKSGATGAMSRLVKSHPKSPPKKVSVILSPRKLPLEVRTGTPLKGVKRKAESPENESSKRTRHSTDENALSPGKQPGSPQASGSSNRVLASLDNTESASQLRRTASRKLFDGSACDSPSKEGSPTKRTRTPRKGSRTPSKSRGTPMKTRNTPSKSGNTPSRRTFTFQSPTANLPDFVNDPQQRTPKALNAKSGSAKKTPNWLTLRGLQRKEESQLASQTVKNDTESKLDAKCKTPSRKTPTRKARKTPTSKTNTPTSKAQQTPTSKEQNTPTGTSQKQKSESQQKRTGRSTKKQTPQRGNADIKSYFSPKGVN